MPRSLVESLTHRSVQASNGTITIPSVTGGDSQYVVTSTGLNQSSSAPSSGIPTDLVGTVSLVIIIYLMTQLPLFHYLLTLTACGESKQNFLAPINFVLAEPGTGTMLQYTLGNLLA